MLSNKDKNYIIKYQGSQTQDFHNYLTSPEIRDNILSPILMEISDLLNLDNLNKFRLAAFDDQVLHFLLKDLNEQKELPNKINHIIYVGKRGGKYIKKDGGFKLLRKRF